MTTNPTLRQVLVTGKTALSEVWVGSMTAAWGIIVLLHPATLDGGRLFVVLLRHAEGAQWGMLALTLGLVMLVAVDRGWRRLRIAAALAVLFMWLFVVGAILSVSPYATVNVWHFGVALRAMWIAWRLLMDFRNEEGGR